MDFTLYIERLQLFIDWLFPVNCVFCKYQPSLKNNLCCDQCITELPFLSNCCSRCGNPLTSTQDYCGHCLSAPPSYDACFCAFEYSAPIDDAIRQLKYTDSPQVARKLAAMLATQIQDQIQQLPDALVCVPVHSTKLRERGFNQSFELAKQLSKLLKIPLIPATTLKKTRTTPAQASLTLKQRKNNLKGSLKQYKTIAYNHVAIIDDVITTGTTVEEIAKILKKNGVDYIQVWGVARTL